MKAFAVIALVVLAIVGLLLGLRTRLKDPSPDVMDRAKQRARDQAAADKSAQDR